MCPLLPAAGKKSLKADLIREIFLKLEVIEVVTTDIRFYHTPVVCVHSTVQCSLPLSWRSCSAFHLLTPPLLLAPASARVSHN